MFTLCALLAGALGCGDDTSAGQSGTTAEVDSLDPDAGSTGAGETGQMGTVGEASGGVTDSATSASGSATASSGDGTGSAGSTSGSSATGGETSDADAGSETGATSTDASTGADSTEEDTGEAEAGTEDDGSESTTGPSDVCDAIDLPDDPPAECSKDEGDEVVLTFINRCDDTRVRVMMLDAECNESQIRMLKVGDIYSHTARAGEVYRVRSQGGDQRLLVEVGPAGSDRTVVIP